MGCGATAQSKYTDEAKLDGPEGGKSKQEFKADNAEFMENMQFLLQVPLLKRLPADQHPLLAEACETCAFNAQHTIFKQGEPGTEFFLIRSGEASVCISKDGKAAAKVATLKRGDYFGEQSLMVDEPRGATIVTDSKLECLKITRAKFEKLGLNEKLNFLNRNRNAVGGGNGRTMEAKSPTAKTNEERKLMERALKANENLSAIGGMESDKVTAMIDCSWKESIPAGQTVIQEGDIVADYFYIVQEGKFSVSIDDPNKPGQKVVVEMVRQGGSFGELALLYLVPRAATVIALEPGVVWVIDRANFKNILMKSSAAQLATYVTLLKSVEVLTPLLAEEKKTLAKALVEMHFIQDEIILRQGDPGSTFYILYEGEVTVIKDGQEQCRLVAAGIGSSPQIFGEKALLHNEPRAATVSVSSHTAKVLALDRDSFTMLLGPLQEILDAAGKGSRSAAKGSGAANRGWTTQRISREDLKKVGLLGCGGFGAVELWEHKQTQNTYALKALSKGFIMKTGMQEAVMNEKNILTMTNSDFIIKLYATYNSTQFLYFLLEPALGGELYATYTRRGLHGSEKHARYYVAGVVYAFEHLHERRIIYRDLKPENLLFTEKGFIKLTDMGLAKFVVGKTFTTCGTPDYFAPEVIQSTGHTSAVDWWALGILLFELLTGHPPFESPSPMQIYSKVLRGVDRLIFPPACHGNAEQLVRALLQKDASKRLPVRSGGIDNIKKDIWYRSASFDWDAMHACKLPPPYKPTVKSKNDIANFSARKEDMPRAVEYHDDGSGWDKDFATV